MVKNINFSQREHSFYIHSEPDGSSKGEMRTYHLHDDFEIYFLIKGERAYIVHNIHYPIKEQSLVFINRNIAHKTATLNNHNYYRIVMNFRESFIPQHALYLIDILFSKSPTVVTLNDQDTMRFSQIVEILLYEYNERQCESSLYIQALLIQLLILSKRLYEKQSDSSSNIYHNQPSEVLISRVMKYIYDQLEKDLPLQQLAKEFHISEQHLCRQFRRWTGCTVVQYINAVRVNEAKRLLIETDEYINTISKKVGYSNHAHFCRVFKQHLGISPSTYRDKHRIKG
ncbi:AraC family transcriptional regulator [Alkalihalobacillus hemicellulosilyticus]|uniref:Transcriptional regulator n=1 Tax=Halalkalibacter hemicellulosilyticusJCM 9152 TaxID=1236971 RepID=W4QB08_9BACI|nr:AraC family transcriptional regulator [Halalkalibacter hemicellulosilyticus]GAE28853.1 transcriptional regulator [Halalkalibacter hemicellulosilyticusJCM 9152]